MKLFDVTVMRNGHFIGECKMPSFDPVTGVESDPDVGDEIQVVIRVPIGKKHRTLWGRAKLRE